MPFDIHRIQVWSSELPDRPGAAAAKLELLARIGADLELVFTQPHPEHPHTQVLLVAPILGPEQIQAAQAVGLAPDPNVVMLCLKGDNRSGIGFEMMSNLAVAGIKLRGLSVSTVDNRFAAYLALENEDSATLAVQVLATLV